MEVYAGEKSFKNFNTWLPDETIEAFREFVVGIKGPLTTPVGGGIRSLNVALRKELDLYVCQRPVRWFKDLPSTVKYPERVNMVTFRENTEDLYAGIEFAAGTPENERFLHLLQENFPEEYERIRFKDNVGHRRQAHLARRQPAPGARRDPLGAGQQPPQRHPGAQGQHHEVSPRAPSATGATRWPKPSSPSGPIPAASGSAAKASPRREAANQEQETAIAAGKLLIKDVIADIVFEQTITRADEFDVLATMNLNGDYLSDALAAQVGGVGIAPGGNINYDHRDRRLRGHPRHRAHDRQSECGQPLLAAAFRRNDAALSGLE